MTKRFLIILVMVSWCNVGFAEKITIKCVTTKMEVMGKEENKITGEKHASQEPDIFTEVDTNDKDALKTDLMYIWVNISKAAERDSKDKYVSYETINRYDLTRYTKSILVDEKTANDYKALWESRKNDSEALNKFIRKINIQYININSYDDIDNFTTSRKYSCEKIEKKF